MSNKYKPINCNFYDELEAYATLRKEVLVQYMVGGMMIKTESMIIKDFLTKNGEEFLISTKGTKIRLDNIMAVTEV